MSFREIAPLQTREKLHMLDKIRVGFPSNKGKPYLLLRFGHIIATQLGIKEGDKLNVSIHKRIPTILFIKKFVDNTVEAQMASDAAKKRALEDGLNEEKAEQIASEVYQETRNSPGWGVTFSTSKKPENAVCSVQVRWEDSVPERCRDGHKFCDYMMYDGGFTVFMPGTSLEDRKLL